MDDESLTTLSELMRQLAKASTFQEVKTIVDKAEALRVLAKRVGASLKTQNEIAEARLRAEKRGGHMLQEMEKSKGGRPKKNQTHNGLGFKVSEVIERHLAARWQQLSKIPDEEFDRIIQETKDNSIDELTRTLMFRWLEENDKTKRRKDRIVKVKRIAERSIDPVTGQGKFPLIYADPPWRYDFSIDESDEIDSHYPTMSIDELCELKVSDAATEDAILFIWTTSPKLEESFFVINAWGFQYRTCGIWDKEWIGPGYYFRQRHELLLVATRGELPPPLPSNRPDSIFAERRSSVHSKKPEIAYRLIERMYPELPKLELFNREPRNGWLAWGNEANRRC